MEADLSPLSALVRICEALPQCNDPDARQELIEASATIRQLVIEATGTATDASPSLSPTARRLLSALGGQELQRTTWAMSARVSPTSGTFCRAIQELMDADLVERTAKAYYRRISGAAQENPKIFDGVSSDTNAV